jgi:hypothetical protein
MRINCVYDFISPYGIIPNGFPLEFIDKLAKYDYDINNSEFVNEFFKERTLNVKSSLLMYGFRSRDLSTNQLVLKDGYIVDKSELFFYNICSSGHISATMSLRSESKHPHVLTYISDKIKDLLKKSKNLYIVIEYIMEGQVDMNVIDSIYLHCKFNNIPLNKIIFVTSVFNIEEIHERYCKQTPQTEKIKIISYNWALPFKSYELQHKIGQRDNDLEMFSNSSINTNFINGKRPKKALILNRRLRLHRLILLSMLIEDGYLNKTLSSFDVSMDSFPDFYDWIDGQYFQNTKRFNDPYYVTKSKNGYLKLKNIGKQTLDYDNLHDVVGFGFESSRIYSDTYFSIVTETEFFEAAHFISEKSIKPIMHQHPFVIVGSPNTLKTLKSYGFKTFDKWWDESYDLIQNTNDRFIEIYRIIKLLLDKTDDEWVTMINEMQDVLIHNRNVLLNYSPDKVDKIVFNNFKEVIFNNKQTLF